METETERGRAHLELERALGALRDVLVEALLGVVGQLEGDLGGGAGRGQQRQQQEQRRERPAGCADPGGHPERRGRASARGAARRAEPAFGQLAPETGGRAGGREPRRADGQAAGRGRAGPPDGRRRRPVGRAAQAERAGSGGGGGHSRAEAAPRHLLGDPEGLRGGAGRARGAGRRPRSACSATRKGSPGRKWGRALGGGRRDAAPRRLPGDPEGLRGGAGPEARSEYVEARETSLRGPAARAWEWRR